MAQSGSGGSQIAAKIFGGRGGEGGDNKNSNPPLYKWGVPTVKNIWYRKLIKRMLLKYEN